MEVPPTPRKSRPSRSTIQTPGPPPAYSSSAQSFPYPRSTTPTRQVRRPSPTTPPSIPPAIQSVFEARNTRVLSPVDPSKSPTSTPKRNPCANRQASSRVNSNTPWTSAPSSSASEYKNRQATFNSHQKKPSTSFKMPASRTAFVETVLDEDFLPGAHPNCEGYPGDTMVSSFAPSSLETGSSATPVIERASPASRYEVASTETPVVEQAHAGSSHTPVVQQASAGSRFEVTSSETTVVRQVEEHLRTVVSSHQGGGVRASMSPGTGVGDRKSKAQTKFHLSGALFELRLNHTRGVETELIIKIGYGKFECLSLALLALSVLILAFATIKLTRST